MIEPLLVSISRLPHGLDLPLPAYQTEGAAGMDLLAAVNENAPVVLAPGQRVGVPTGIAIALPPGYEAQVRGRSGLARRFGIGLVNAPGTVDSDYRGEIVVLLINWGHEAFTIQRGERIAQIVVAPVTRIVWNPVENPDDLDTTARGRGGFGHTGGHDALLPSSGAETV